MAQKQLLDSKMSMKYQHTEKVYASFFSMPHESSGFTITLRPAKWLRSIEISDITRSEMTFEWLMGWNRIILV